MYTDLVRDISSMYAIFVAVGGLMGYFQAGSLASLVAGLTAGAVAMIGSMLVRNPQRIDLGLKLILSVSAGLVFVFQRRLQDTGFKFMPGGFMILNSAGLIVLSVLAMKERSDLAKQSSRKTQ